MIVMRDLAPELIKHLLNISDDIFFVLDQNLKILFISRGIEKLDYTTSDLINKSISRILSGTGDLILSKRAKELLEGAEAPRTLNLLLERKNGETVPARIKIEAVRAGDKVFILGIAHLTRKLNKAEEILNSIDTGVILVDIRGCITYINRYAAKLLGKNGIDSLEKLPADLRQKLWRIATNKEKKAEIPIEGGKILGVSAYPYTEGEKEKGWVLFFKDITETKLMERAMAQVDKFSTLGTLASGLAHEIKNPLAGMRLLAQSLERELQGKQLESIKRMKRQIDRIDNLIKKFFSYAKPHLSHRVSCPIEETLKEVEALIEENLEKKKITLIKEIPPGLAVKVDPHHFQQILLNLLLNAIDALDEGGTIWVQAGRSKIEKSTSNTPYIYISVKDNGVGIDEEEIDKIFYPFYTTKSEGIGLGLFIVHQLVKENGGLIEVKSKKNEGTEFIIYFESGVSGE